MPASTATTCTGTARRCRVPRDLCKARWSRRTARSSIRMIYGMSAVGLAKNMGLERAPRRLTSSLFSAIRVKRFWTGKGKGARGRLRENGFGADAVAEIS